MQNTARVGRNGEAYCAECLQPRPNSEGTRRYLRFALSPLASSLSPNEDVVEDHIRDMAQPGLAS